MTIVLEADTAKLFNECMREGQFGDANELIAVALDALLAAGPNHLDSDLQAAIEDGDMDVRAGHVKTLDEVRAELDEASKSAGVS